MLKISITLLILTSLFACGPTGTRTVSSASESAELNESYRDYYLASENLFEPVKSVKNFINWTKRNTSINARTNLASIRQSMGNNSSGVVNLGIGRKIHYGVSNRYLTTDQIGLNTNGVISDLFNSAAPAAAPLPIHFSISSSQRIEFTRESNTLQTAAFLAPKNPLDLPLSSRNAIDHMNPRELLSIPVRMGFSLGLGKKLSLSGTNANALVGVFWTGSFRLNIFKTDASHIVVSLIPNSSRGIRISAGVQTHLSTFGIAEDGSLLGMKELVSRGLIKQIERALGFDVLRFSSTYVQKGERMVLEYSFNLADQRGREAYDNFISNTRSLKWLDPRIFSPRDPQNLAFADLSQMESLHAQAYANGTRPTNAPVYRTHRYTEEYNGLTSSGHIGFKPLRYKGDQAATNHIVSSFDAGDRETTYRVNRFRMNQGIESWVHAARKKTSYDAWAVSENIDNLNFKALVIDHRMTDQKIFDLKHGNYRNSLRTLISSPWYSSIKLEQVMVTPDETRNKYYEHFDSKIRLSYNKEFIQDLAESLYTYPNADDARLGLSPKDLLLKRLQWAASVTYKDANKTYNRRLPLDLRLPLVFLDNLLGGIRNSISNTYDLLMNLGWKSGEDKVIHRLIQIMLTPRANSIAASDITTETIQTLDDTVSAPRVVPGFLNALCSLYNSCAPQIKIAIDHSLQEKFEYRWNAFEFEKSFNDLKMIMKAPQSNPLVHYYR